MVKRRERSDSKERRMDKYVCIYIYKCIYTFYIIYIHRVRERVIDR